jgi:DNA transformation protein
MAPSSSLRDFVLDQLAELGAFETRKMFGGVALLHGGAAFARIKHDKVWLKVDDDSRADFVARGMPQYTYGKDGSRRLHFYETPIEVLEDRETFVRWARRAQQAASGSSGAP